jgi:hypothetical protein
MATAAVRLADRDACAELLAELEPVTTACGVNGALVCFSGSNAHWAGLLADALGERERARDLLEHALAVHRRLGARVWEAESCAALAALEEPGEHAARAGLLAAQLGLPRVAAQLTDPAADAELRRDGELWLVGYRGSVAHLRDLKGLADLAVLIARPRVDVHVLALVGAGPHDRPSGDLLDAPARAAYRHRLAELDRELAATRPGPDPERARRLERERAALGAEVERAAGLGGRSRPLGASTVERARKAVTARIRDAVRRIGAAHPELGAHLDRSVITGTSCRYDPVDPLVWTLSVPAVRAR